MTAIDDLRKLLDFTTKEHHEVVRAAAAVCEEQARQAHEEKEPRMIVNEAKMCAKNILSALEPEAKR